MSPKATIYPDMIAVEAALLDWLAVDQRLDSWGIKPTQLPGLSSKEDIARLFAGYPAIGTYVSGAKYVRSQMPRANIEKGVIQIVCAGGNYRSAVSPRAGGQNAPGATHLVEWCRRQVEDWPTLGTNLVTVEPTGWTLAWCNKQIAVCVLSVDVELTRAFALSEEVLEDLGAGYPAENE